MDLFSEEIIEYYLAEEETVETQPPEYEVEPKVTISYDDLVVLLEPRKLQKFVELESTSEIEGNQEIPKPSQLDVYKEEEESSSESFTGEIID
jgi:hypothetical protein